MTTHGLAPGRLEIEVTETTLLNCAAVVKALADLGERLGVRWSPPLESSTPRKG